MNFFVGNIESITDPLKNGRVKCRVLGDHTSDKEILPTDDLPVPRAKGRHRSVFE